MTHAKLLRSHANLAIKEGGMYYSGEYLSRMADVAESLETENAKLREQGERLFDKASELGTENAKLRLLVRNLICATHPADRAKLIVNAAELGIEVDS